MLTFYDEKGNGYGAQVEFTTKNAVNGERSVSGTILSNDKVLSKIDRGWSFDWNGETYKIIYAKPKDEGWSLSVSFDAVHQFFYDFDHSNCYQVFNGSNRFEVYIEAIFKNSGYRYVIEAQANAIRKENFGNAKRLSMFKDIIKAAGLEFSVTGKVVRIVKKVGTDLSTVVRKNFNMNELTLEKNIGAFITYKKGFGAWKNEENHDAGRYETEYESPLARIYGRIEGEPVSDERYKDTGKLLERLKFEVDNSYSISVQLDMEDLTRAGYQYTQPRAGDYIMAINETIGFREKIRIVSFESSYDVTGRLINHKVTCNDIGAVQKQISSEGSIIRSVGQSKEYAESALAVATKALVSADGKNTVYYGATKPKDEPIGTIRRGDILYLTAGEDTEMYIWNGAEWELKKLKFDTTELEKEFDKVKKAAEEADQAILESIGGSFELFRENLSNSVQALTDEALEKARASSSLAKEAKRISLESISKLEEFKRQATSAQTALSGDVDILKRTVNNEVNQASEYRRTTTEILSRMTGQMNGFATKSEVRQDVTGLTEAFAKLKTDTNNLISGAKSEITLAKTEFKKTADGLSTKMAAVETYVSQDGQRQETLQRYAREESAKQATAVREQISRDYVGKSDYQEDARGIERRFSEIGTQTNNDIATKIAQYKQTVDGQFANITSQIAGKANQTDFQRVKETSQLYERILGNTENGIADKVARMALTNQLFQIEVSKNEGLKTVQRQLAGSWAVKNLTNNGDVLNSINVLADGTNRIDGRLTHITGQTKIDNAVIKDGMIANLSADKVNFGTLNGNQVNIINLNAKSITSGTFRGLMFEGGIIRGLNGNTEINLNNNTTTYNGTASIVFKSPYNQLEFNSGGRKAFLAPTISTGTNYAAFALGVNDRGNGNPNRDFVGFKIFNEPGSRVIEVVGDLIITNPDNQSTNTTSLKALFKAINDNFKMLKEFRIQYGEGSPGFYDVSLR